MLIRASDEGWVAAPMIWVIDRSTIRLTALHAPAVSAVETVASAKPARKTRRWPWRSPIFPSTGSASADSRIGSVTTHIRVVSATPKSSAMSGIATVSTVIGKVVANIPVSAVRSTQRG